MARISIIFPCFNQPQLLAEAFSNLENSSEKKFTKIIKDDFSSSDYQFLLTDNKWQPLKYLRNEQNLGAINNMISCLFTDTEEDYLMCHHEDDLLHRNYLKIALDYLDTNPDIAFIASQSLLFRKKEEIKDQAYPMPTIKKYNYRELANFCVADNNLAFGSVIYRKKFLNKDQIDTKTYAMFFDRPFLLKILENKHITGAIIKAPLYFYRHHPYPDKRWQGLKIENVFNLFLKYKQIDSKNRILARYFFDFAGLDNKRVNDFKYFFSSLAKLKLTFCLPTFKSLKFIVAGLIILIFGKKTYSQIFSFIKNTY